MVENRSPECDEDFGSVDEGEYLEVSWGGDDGDGVGRLTVVASANGFGGRSSAWFDRGTIERFADELGRYPLDPQHQPEIDGGFGGNDPQVHVRLHAYPVGHFGQIAFGVDLATEHWPDNRIDARHAVRLELPTTYERLGAFARDLRRLTESNGRSARIEAERLRT